MFDDDGYKSTYIHDLYRTKDGEYVHTILRTSGCESTAFRYKDFERLKNGLNPVTRANMLKIANPDYDIEQELKKEGDDNL